MGAFLLVYHQLSDVIEGRHHCLDCILRYSTNCRYDPNLDDLRHVISECLAEANEDSLDQAVDHRSTCMITKERRRSHAATVNASRNALRKEERRRQRAATEATIAGTETSPAPATQLPSNLRPGRESSAPNQTEIDNPMIMDGAVWEDEGTLDWVLRVSNDVSSIPGGTSVQVDARVKGPQPQTQLLVIIEPREKFKLKRGVDIGGFRGIQWWKPGNPLKCKVANVATTLDALVQLRKKRGRGGRGEATAGKPILATPLWGMF